MSRILRAGLLILTTLGLIPVASEAFSSADGPTGCGAHGDITQAALVDYGFSPDAIKIIERANVAQDRHPLDARRHHDRWNGESVEKACARGKAYIEREFAKLMDYLESGDCKRARKALARVSHTIQDAFSHSNYCDMSVQDQEQFIRAVVHGEKFPASTMITGFPFRDASDRYRYSHAEHAKDEPRGEEGEGSQAFEKAKTGAVKATKELLERVRDSLAENDRESAEAIWESFTQYN